MSIDINCDMGEGYGLWRMGPDEEIMPLITSANVACGAHAGDPNVMAATIRLAKSYDVAVGAHPSFPDLNGFGRRVLPLPAKEVKRWVLYQLGALAAIARAEGIELAHVKAHGALYNAAARDEPLAEAIVGAVKSFSAQLPLFCPPGSWMDLKGHELGVRIVREGFADRAYEPNGSLMDRSKPGSVHRDPERAARQALQLVNGSVTATDGSVLPLKVETICVHSDTQGSTDILRAIRELFQAEGIDVAPVSASSL